MKKLLYLVAFLPLFCFGQMRPEAHQTITSGTATTITNGVGVVVVNPASVLLTHTITLPSTPHDRDILIIQFGGTITGTGAVVTTLTIAAGGVITLLGALPTTATAGMCLEYIYNVRTNSWYRLL